MDNWIKNREYLLKNDQKQSFLGKWERQSKRFGKKRIFNLFSNAYNKLNEDDTEEKYKLVVGWLINKLKDQKNISYFKKKSIYSDISSLFGKFKYSMQNKLEKDLCEVFCPPIDIQSLLTIQKSNQYIQLSLFDEFDKIENKKIKKENKEFDQDITEIKKIDLWIMHTDDSYENEYKFAWQKIHNS